MNDHVLITGGSRGIGAATVLEFAQAGQAAGLHIYKHRVFQL
jgi:NAD(P)-dependent dehydrogenase (short-subunit alcohol dehydrogenase family)